MVRNENIDGLRGLLILIICINHIGSVLSKLTTGTYGFLTAMEGFVFLSGFVAGVVYYKKFQQLPFFSFIKSTSYRTYVIYKYHMSVVFLLCVCVLFWRNSLVNANWPWVPLVSRSFFESLFAYGTLFNSSPHLQILPIYCVLVFLLPLAMVLIRYAGLIVTFSMSVFLWVLSQYGLECKVGAYNLLSWQFLFVGGVCVGVNFFQQNNISEPAYLSRSFQIILVALYAVFFVVNALNHDAFNFLSFSVKFKQYLNSIGFYLFVEKTSFGPVRVLNFIAMLAFIYTLLAWWPSLFRFKLLQFLGRHTLQIFTFQILVVFLLAAFNIRLIDQPLLINLFVTVLMILSIFGVSYFYSRFKRYVLPRRIK